MPPLGFARLGAACRPLKVSVGMTPTLAPPLPCSLLRPAAVAEVLPSCSRALMSTEVRGDALRVCARQWCQRWCACAAASAVVSSGSHPRLQTAIEAAPKRASHKQVQQPGATHVTQHIPRYLQLQTYPLPAPITTLFVPSTPEFNLCSCQSTLHAAFVCRPTTPRCLWIRTRGS